MGEICLSVAPILRCQSLTRTEAGILLIPTGLEIVFAIVLLWAKRGSDKKHVFIAAEVFIYFVLALLDVFTHTLPSIGTSLDSFKALDITIGAASTIPLFLYMFFLYVLTAYDLIPILPIRFQSISKYLLLAFIPLVLLLNELGSFIGITYRQFGGNGAPVVLGVGFTNVTAEIFLSSVTLVLLISFQAANFFIAFYRLVRALSHQRTLDMSQQEKEMEAHLFRGLGWIVAGTKLGAIETVVGFAPGEFGTAFTRRVLRLLSHACLIIGILKGVDTVEDFQLYSPGEAQKRRKSMLRAMIQNPRLSTFRHVGGHDFEKNPFEEKRQSVIKLGDPSWMRRDVKAKPGQAPPGSTLTARFPRKLSKRGPRQMLRRQNVNLGDSDSSFASPIGNSWTHVKAIGGYAEVVDLSDLPAPVPRIGLPSRPNERVTVHIRKDRLPVLELRRFSDLDFLDLIHNRFRDSLIRSRSLPDTLEPDKMPVGLVSASFTPYPMYASPDAATPPLPDTLLFRRSRAASFESYDRPWSGVSGRVTSFPSFTQRLSPASTEHNASRPPSAASFHAIGSPSSAVFKRSSSSKPPSRFPSTNSSRRDKGTSASTTASEVRALAVQFPGIPPRHFNQATRRSMLSREVSRTEFVVDSDEPVPSATVSRNPSVAASRASSVKNKPAPLITEGLADARLSHVEIEQVVDEEDVAMRSLPTPVSPPRGYVPARTLAHARSHSSSRVADVPISARDSFDSGLGMAEVPIVHGASIVQRGTQQGTILRVKSFGQAPIRTVSASARQPSMSRDSIKVELGMIAAEGQAEQAASGS